MKHKGMDCSSEEFKDWLRDRIKNMDKELEEHKENTKEFQRTTTVSVKFSPYEREELKEKADELCMSLSEYIRYAIREME